MVSLTDPYETTNPDPETFWNPATPEGTCGTCGRHESQHDPDCPRPTNGNDPALADGSSAERGRAGRGGTS